MDSANVVFFGSGSLGVPCLQELARRGCIDVVVSQPDRPAGRGRVNTPTPISTAALECGLKLIRTDNANQLEIREQCARAKVIVVIAFGQKLLPELIADRVAINLHPSALPKWRGAAPIQRAMMAGEQRITACAMAVAERMDAGAIYARHDFELGATETAGELHDRIARDSVEMMLQTIERARVGAIIGQEQIFLISAGLLAGDRGHGLRSGHWRRGSSGRCPLEPGSASHRLQRGRRLPAAP